MATLAYVHPATRPHAQMLVYRTYELGPDREWVVFVHGAGGSSAIWFRQVRAFREQFNLLLVDLRGHGQSQPAAAVTTRPGYTFDAIAGEILDALDDAGIQRAHFVGISLGSVLIRVVETLAPERVASMVVGGAIVRLGWREQTLIALGNALKRVLPFIWLYSLFAWIFMPRRAHRASRRLFIQEAHKVEPAEFLRWFPLTAHLEPLLRQHRNTPLRAPALFLMGEEDYLCLPPARQFVSTQPLATLGVVARAGHVCNVDRPLDFNRQALAFLREQS